MAERRSAEFEEFYDANRDACLRAVLASTADPRVAEDLVAEAFARAWMRWSKVRRHPAPRAWVVRTALNAGVSRWRKQRRERPLADEDIAAAEAGSDKLDAVLLAALRQLPRRQREVVALRVFLDLDIAETANALGIAPGTVTAHLSRAITTLRHDLDPTNRVTDDAPTDFNEVTNMNDADVLNQLSESLSGVHMDLPVDTIVARGRSRQRHQRSRRIVTGAAAALVTVVAVLTFGSHSSTPPASTRGNIHLAAFTLAANPDGTATLTLIKGVPLDADALRQKLVQAGVPAVVTVGRACSNPVADSAALDQVVSVQQRTDGTVVMVITPSAMPNGSELSIGVFPTHKTWTLATADAPLTCTTNPNH